MAKTETTLLSPDFIRRIEQLRMVAKKVVVGRMKGERRSKRRGTSVEFADYRNYVKGDDLRFIDWNIYARLDRLFLKLFEEEEDLHVYILVDVSSSMDHGDPNKGFYARQLAAALGYIALSNMDRVGIGLFAGNLREMFRPARGKHMVWRMMKFLEEAKVEGPTHLEPSILDFVIRYGRPGIAIIISDFYDREGYEEAVKLFLARRLETYVFHVMSPDEVEPELRGDLKLVDCEDGDETEITISAPLLKRYKQNLDAFRGGLKEFCAKRGMNYIFTRTDIPIDALVLDFLRKRGLLR